MPGPVQIVSGSFEFSTLTDVPFYFDEWFAWSNVSQTVNVFTEPTPNGGWSTSIPNKGNYAFLWRKSIRHTLNTTNNTYVTENAQYIRMNGADGTSIHTKGNVKYQNSSQGTGTALNLISNPSDGDAYTVDLDLQGNEGWLYQWAAESNSWIPLGQFKGEPGKTYYSHIVWATNIVFNGTTITRIDGYTPAKSPNDTTHLWMGVHVDENAQDPESGSDDILKSYTWSFTQGAKGESACVMSANPNILAWNTNNDEQVVQFDAKDVTWAVHQGEDAVSGDISDGHTPLPLGFSIEVVTNRIYRITPHEYYLPFTGDNGPLYINKGTYSVGDPVYNSAGDQIGTVSAATSGTITVSSAHGMWNGKTYTKTAAVRTTLAAPATVLLRSIYGDYEGTTTLVLMPNKQGVSNIVLDLDNMHDAIQYVGTTKVGADASTHARLYVGGTEKTSEVTAWQLDDTSSCTAARVGNTNEFKVSAIAANQLRGVLIIRATRGGKFYYATFTVDKLVDKPKYELEIDKPVVSANTDVTSAHSTNVRVRVYKTVVNATGGVTRTNVKSLAGEGLKLWQTDGTHQPEEVVDGSGSGNYRSGGYYDFSAFYSRPSASFWLTNSQATYSTLEDNMYDMEIIPIVTVKNGEKGDPGAKGDAARQPYEWGTWEDFIANNNNTFTANKYETPFFVKNEEVTLQSGIKGIKQTKWLWVGDDGVYVPPSATPASGQKKSTTPSSSDTNWSMMITDNKYLMTEVVLSDYGKIGSGIFDRDYAFSQYGILDGNSLNHYKNFRPEFFKGLPYTLFQGSKVIQGNIYNSESSMYAFGEIFLEETINYTFHFAFRSVTSLVNIRLFDLTTNTPLSQWQLGTNESQQTHPDGQSNILSGRGGRSYLVCAFMQTAMAGATADFTSITVEASKAFKPNFYIDWLQGEVYAQLGRFVNVVIEGVINNLIQTIDANNKNNYGVTDSDGNFWLNPTKVGSIIRYTNPNTLGLPSAFTAEPFTETHLCDSGDTVHQLTLDELRQCVGKRIYVLTAGNNGNMHLLSGMAGNPTLQQVDIPQLRYKNDDGDYEWTYDYNSATLQSQWFYILECMMGDDGSGHEHIFWHLEATCQKLPDTIAQNSNNN